MKTPTIRNQCTGCFACVIACPKQCIQISSGKLLHLYPRIEEDKCIECNFCRKICPNNINFDFNAPTNTYACWANDKREYLSSASGGIGSVLSRLIINRGGVVYGCSCESGIDIRHIRVDSLSNIDKLKGSKYVQSDIRGCYQAIKTDVFCNRLVLFIGTPCQIAAIKSFLGKEYENLLLVDIICHGVPSRDLLYTHIKGITNLSDCDKIKFREGNDFTMTVENDCHLVYKTNLWKERYKDFYYNAFMDGYTYRDSCYECKYAGPKRISDITIGDFWGLGHDVEYDKKNGISCVLVNTHKGMLYFDQIRDSIHCVERTLQEAINGNDQLRGPKLKTFRIRIFRVLHNWVGNKNAYSLLEFDHLLAKNYMPKFKSFIKRIIRVY